jgi:hypothetical protein
MFGQFAQQHELKAGQGDGTAPRVGGEVGHVQSQAAGSDAWAGIFPEPEADAREQFGQQEWLGQVILGAAFEAIDFRGGVVHA